MNVIGDFRGDYRFLSNYHVEKSGTSVEHVFQASKATNHEDFEFVMLAERPKDARGRGQGIKIKENWEEIKFDMMYNALVTKFKDPELREGLLATNDAYLEEGNWWHDNCWGNCTCDKCRETQGKNMLGLLLMRVRHEIRKEYFDGNV